MKILTVTSGKGGVGKTTLALNVARQLSLHGCKTLLVDFDIHNKGTTNLFLDKLPSESGPSVTELVSRSNKFDFSTVTGLAERVKPIGLEPSGSIFLIPASKPKEMIRWEGFHARNDQIVAFFSKLLHDIGSKFGIDVIVIDCYGGIDSLTVAAAGIADDTIIVNEPDVITFSGTLVLYEYLGDTYASSPRKPRVHFAINRVTSRHSFSFLDKEYRKYLTPLAADQRILAYFPYDKLVMETFGDYPFFTELLPTSLITEKTLLLIHDLWKDLDLPSAMSRSSLRKQRRIYQKTSETAFADPERIIRTVVAAPMWVSIPVAAVAMLSRSSRFSLPYTAIWQTYYFSLALLGLITLGVAVFEPIQISRWLLRSAKYHFRKRWLTRRQGVAVAFSKSAVEFVFASIPALLGVCFLGGSVYFGLTYASHNNFPKALPRNLSIWHGKVYGFAPGKNYAYLKLGAGAPISERSDLSRANMYDSNLIGVRLAFAVAPEINLANSQLVKAVFDGAKLQGAYLTNVAAAGASFQEADLSGAHLDRSRLDRADFSHTRLSGATLTNASLESADLSYAGLDNADFTDARLYGTSLRGANLRGAKLDIDALEDVDIAGADFGGSDRAEEVLFAISFGGGRLDDRQRQKIHRDYVGKRQDLISGYLTARTSFRGAPNTADEELKADIMELLRPSRRPRPRSTNTH